MDLTKRPPCEQSLRPVCHSSQHLEAKEKGASKQGSLNATHLEEIKVDAICMVSLRDFPCNNALFGLVSYNDPCLEESPNTPETKLQHKLTTC